MQPGDLVRSTDATSPHFMRVGEVKSVADGVAEVEFRDHSGNKIHFGAISLVSVESSKLERVQQA